jgi:hypothetical protein
MLSQIYTGLHVKYPTLLSDLNETLIFFNIVETTEISDFIKILLVGAEFFHADGQRNLTVAFRNFADGPKMAANNNIWYEIK